VLGASLLTTLPPVWLISAAAAAAAIGLTMARTRSPALMVLAFCWSVYNFQTRLDDRVDPAFMGKVIEVTGLVSSIPVNGSDYLSFRFRPDSEYLGAGLPTTLLVHWYRNSPVLRAGERWQLDLGVKPPWGRVNFQGADKERWLFAQGIGGLGSARGGFRLSGGSGSRVSIHPVRQRVLDSISRQVAHPTGRAVVQALATADRSGLSGDDRQLLAATGTSHLLAISGLHVGLAAAGGMWLSRVLVLAVPVQLAGGVILPVTLAGGLLGAAGYAALADFGTPTVRAVLMLFTALAALSLQRAIHPFRAWGLSLAFILLINPFAPLGAGLWFTFLAVAALLFVFLPRTGRLKMWQTLLMAQAGVVLVLLPVGAAWFHSFSPAGFVANLVAIPWVSVLVVPPVLAGLALLPFSEALAGLLWTAGSISSVFLLQLLELMARLQGQVPLMSPPSAVQTALALLGAFIVLLPRGIPARWLGLFLVLPLFYPPGERVKDGGIEVEVLDAGQGTAVLVSSSGQSLLYDSGPGDGRDFNLVSTVIAPALARLGPDAPGRVVISHGDLDHAGGLYSLRKRYPRADYLANVPGLQQPIPPCRAPMRWHWHGIDLKTLHPSPGLPYLGNDSSCVISVGSGNNRLLLSGDISEVIENRLMLDPLPRHRVLLVPHHGSKTSSGSTFIETLRPEAAIATAALGNRFGFPRPEIRRRYEIRGTQFWSTGECGALRLVLRPGESLRATSARRVRDRIWRWPATDNCP
jgi:competence protein ComEC